MIKKTLATLKTLYMLHCVVKMTFYGLCVILQVFTLYSVAFLLQFLYIGFLAHAREKLEKLAKYE